MFRKIVFFRRRKVKTETCFLAGALFMAMFICKNVLYHHLQPVTNNSSQTLAPIKNNSYVYSWPPCQRNLSAANSSKFSTYNVNFQNFLYYHHCRHYPMLLDVPDKCGGADNSANVFLLLVIKSSPGNYDRREVLRKTWAEERLYNGVWIRRVFIVGTMEPGLEKERLDRLLELEQREYNDILQWDFKDSFYNLTVKQILFLEWMETNCNRAHFVLNGDDDVFANTDNMIDYLQNLKDNDGSKHLFTGFLMDGSPPIREVNSKYFVSEQLFQRDSFPPYCSGGGYLMSVYTASVIYNMSHSIPIIPIDDAYMGLGMEKAGLKPTAHMGVEPYGWYIPSSAIDKYDPCYFREKLLVHRMFSANMYFMWKRMHDPNLKCDSTKNMHVKMKTVGSWW